MDLGKLSVCTLSLLRLQIGLTKNDSVLIVANVTKSIESLVLKNVDKSVNSLYSLAIHTVSDYHPVNGLYCLNHFSISVQLRT